MTDVIQTQGLTKQFGNGRGVHGIDLAVAKGQVFGFLGPNGAGKSTFVKLLIGLIKPTQGEARVLGLSPGHLHALGRIGYLPELFRYQDWLTAEEVLRFHSKLCRLDAVRASKRIREVVAQVGLVGRAHERIRGFSKGMQQRLGLACALLAEPDILFLDEPASALDPSGRHDVRRLLSDLGDSGMTIFLNTHLLEDVEAICTHVALLTDGTIRAQGALDDILHPESVWEFTIGGWEPGLMPILRNRVTNLDAYLRVSTPTKDGVVVLEASIQDMEQTAWINAQLVELGVSVYTSGPRENRLESWFLSLTNESEDEGNNVR